MNILGLHFGHDGSACIVKGGKLASALAYERIYWCDGTRHKKCHGVAQDLIDLVLGAANLRFEDVDALALSDYHERWAKEVFDEVTENGQPVAHGHTWDMVFGNEVRKFDVKMRGRTLPAFNPGHHLCHCAAAYYTSPFDQAHCVSMDSSGGRLQSNFLVARGEGLKLTALETPACLMGLAYGQFTEKLGLGPQMFKAGSLMALAAYGRVPECLSREPFDAESYFKEEMAYWGWVEKLWEKVALACGFTDGQGVTQAACDVAATAQNFLTQAIRYAVNYCEGAKVNLCLGGGSFLNCCANSSLLRHPRVAALHLFPACSDDGCSVGAALYAAHHLHNEPRYKYADHEISRLGPHHPYKQPDVGEVAKAISKGAIVAWQHGRAEFGPRALGGRCLLADPRTYKSRERLNFLIKEREWWRPLAPAVLENSAREWFDLPAATSPFMLLTAGVRYGKEIPAAVHADGSARPQTVARDFDSDFYELLHAFWVQTGVPLLLSTSLNGKGEPLCETDTDTLTFWEKQKGVDMLVLHGNIYRR